MQATIDHGTKQQQDQIIDSVEEHCVELSRDPFGNYVVQHILDLARADVPLRIVTRLEVPRELELSLSLLGAISFFGSVEV